MRLVRLSLQGSQILLPEGCTLVTVDVKADPAGLFSDASPDACSNLTCISELEVIMYGETCHIMSHYVTLYGETCHIL